MNFLSRIHSHISLFDRGSGESGLTLFFAAYIGLGLFLFPDPKHEPPQHVSRAIAIPICVYYSIKYTPLTAPMFALGYFAKVKFGNWNKEI